MMTINLHKLRFHAYHGVYEEEQVIGGEFEVNVAVGYQPALTPVVNLHDTINYALVYDLVKQHMQQAYPILETFVTKLANDILEQFSLAEEVDIAITKLNPPIAAFRGSVGVSYKTKRST